ncbi:MAG: amino acid permease [Sphingobacteriia bacterium]|jgi:amino acid transporter
MPQAPTNQLKRTIGVFGLACAVINIMIGSGIFVLPALVAEHLGAAAIICYGICGGLIFLIALCFIEIGTKITGDGGTYAYIEAAFGPFAGFLASNILIFGSALLSDAAVANGLLQIISPFIPFAAAWFFKPIFFLFLFGVLAWINIRGTKEGLMVVITTTIAKLLPLLLIVVFGIGHIVSSNLAFTNNITLHEIGNTSLILFFAFCGIETAVANSGEIINPKKTMPISILLGMLMVLLVYLGVQLVTQGILGNQLNLYKDAPINELGNRLFGPIGISIIIGGMIIAMTGTLSGEIFAFPRLFFAGARKGIYPAFLGKVDPRFVTPKNAIILYASLGFLLSMMGEMKQLVILASASTLLIYLGVVLATIKLRFSTTATSAEAFKIPGGLTIPILATAVIIWMLSNLSKDEMIGMVISLLVLTVIYWGMKKWRMSN